jgi:cell division topological specificity factor
MNIFDFFKLNTSKKSASIAKERLQIVVSHQRGNENKVDFLSDLRQDLLKVISKYIKIDQDQINVQLQKDGNNSILELNVTLPDKIEAG